MLLQTALVFPVERVFFPHAAHRPHNHDMLFQENLGSMTQVMNRLYLHMQPVVTNFTA